MRSVQAFKRAFTQTVTVAPKTGRDAYGQPTYGAAVSYAARIVAKHQLVRGPDGLDVVSTHKVLLMSTANVTPQDQITMPSGFDPTTPPILAVERIPDDRGVHHTTILIGR